ncbi:rab11 family-interacting protein 5 isoform X2 [Sabethes cyaneus]|uniref:rab11 family-interacting protein 5 isoform X2 n=1 Tax=Sabethes cyaneus TaxID=53552 RepID=UPI00237E2A62|nr:rab11 family-interacting protein 5 isoform X2 [Sabethes cyaneus]
MWSPTHIQVTVQRAKGLLIKGKHGTNNCFVIIALGKDKYQTSVKEKAPDAVEWHEECELQIPTQGNRAELVLTALHHNTLGIDEFLGQVILPLNEMDVYERPRSRWFKMQSKPGKEKKKERGELEVRIAFTVKAGSLTDLSKKEKNKSSISNLASNVGGSLLSIGAIEKRKGLKKFAKSLGSKVHISGIGKKKHKDAEGGGPDDASFTGSYSSIGTPSGLTSRQSRQTFGDADPGVISEDEDEFVFDNLSHKSSGSSLNMRAAHGVAALKSTTQSSSSTPDEMRKQKSMTLPPSKPPRLLSEHEHETAAVTKVDEWEQKLYGKHLDIGSTDSLKRRSWENSRVMLAVQQEEEEDRANSRNVPKEPATVAAPVSVTAPTSPLLADKGHTEDNAANDKPRPLPRAGSQDIGKVNEKLVLDNPTITTSNSRKSINHPSPKQEKDSNSFTRKLKHFIKDHRAESMENLSTAAGKKQLNGTKQQTFKPHQQHERIIIGGENGHLGAGDLLPMVARQSKLVTEVSPELVAKYEGKTREDMMKIAHNLENEVHYQKQKVKELEDYLDSLLLKVMECHPKILQNPYQKGHPTKSG